MTIVGEVALAVSVLVTASATPPPRDQPAPDPRIHTVGIPTRSVSGVASWYRWHRGEAAAGPGVRRFLGRHWRGKLVSVCLAQGKRRTPESNCVVVRLTDWCACPKRIIDLDVRAFGSLAPTWRGLVKVEVFPIRKSS